MNKKIVLSLLCMLFVPLFAPQKRRKVRRAHSFNVKRRHRSEYCKVCYKRLDRRRDTRMCGRCSLKVRRARK